MGERAEPMQWALARHRQNSGEQQQQQLPDPETDGSERLPACSFVHMQGKPAARTA